MTKSPPSKTIIKFLGNNSITVMQESDRSLWFWGFEIASALMYHALGSSNAAIIRHAKPADRRMFGLYGMIFGSNATIAKRFKNWVTTKLLPSVRKEFANVEDREDDIAGPEGGSLETRCVC